jgi:hypothetical protein
MSRKYAGTVLIRALRCLLHRCNLIALSNYPKGTINFRVRNGNGGPKFLFITEEGGAEKLLRILAEFSKNLRISPFNIPIE